MAVAQLTAAQQRAVDAMLAKGELRRARPVTQAAAAQAAAAAQVLYDAALKRVE